MRIKIIELATPTDFWIHGNLARTPLNQLRRRLGLNVKHVVAPHPSGNDWQGTVADDKGKQFDWWTDGAGDIVIVPAK